MSKIIAIVALDENHAIGLNNKLPWHLPADLRHFKEVTLGKPIIMGRKTFESIGRPLPGRKNIIVTRDKNFSAIGCDIVHSLPDAIQAASDVDEIFIIGGAQLFAEAMPLVQQLYLTIIHENFKGDTFFPPLNSAEWRETHREDHEVDEKNIYRYSFITMQRIRFQV